MAPITLCIQVAQIEAFLQSQFDSGKCASYFSRYKYFTSNRTFMVKEYSIARVDTVGFAIVDGDPIRIQLGHSIGTPRVKRRCFFLRSLLNQTVEFRC